MKQVNMIITNEKEKEIFQKIPKRKASGSDGVLGFWLRFLSSQVRPLLTERVYEEL